MRSTITLAVALLLASCQSPDEKWLSSASRPITVVAISDNESVVLRDAHGVHTVITSAIASAIHDSYSVGDTLK